MANILCFHLFSFSVLCMLILFQITPTFEAKINGGFSIQLIHRNSTFRPLAHSFYKVATNSPSTKVTSNNGDYLMKLTLGTPPVDLYGLADTGSDLIWAQCIPCDGCYKQKTPLFDPKMSQTYRDIPCDSEQCNLVYSASCSAQNLCDYTYGYADSSVSKGVLAQETFTFASSSSSSGGGGDPVVAGDIVFGCGHSNTGNFNENDMGVIGLGGGPLSLVSQIGTLYGVRRFSQCLVPFHTDPNIAGTLNFGEGSEVTGEGVLTTRLVSGDGETSYLVTLKGISVGDTFVPFSPSETPSQGTIMVDSGTPTTYLPEDFYDQLVEELKGQSTMIPIEDDPDLGSQLCYRSDTNLEGPILTAHFDNDADVPLMPVQTFIPPKDGVFCFAMASSSDGLFIFGSFAQSNLLIGFDLDTKTVSFKPTDCTNQ